MKGSEVFHIWLLNANYFIKCYRSKTIHLTEIYLKYMLFFWFVKVLGTLRGNMSKLESNVFKHREIFWKAIETSIKTLKQFLDHVSLSYIKVRQLPFWNQTKDWIVSNYLMGFFLHILCPRVFKTTLPILFKESFRSNYYCSKHYCIFFLMTSPLPFLKC